MPNEQENLNSEYEKFSAHIEKHPDGDHWYTKRGKVLHKMGKYEEAIKDFDKALEAYNKIYYSIVLNMGEAYLAKAYSYLEKGDWREALRICNECERKVALYNIDWQVKKCRADIYEKAGNYQLALEHTEDLIDDFYATLESHDVPSEKYRDIYDVLEQEYCGVFEQSDIEAAEAKKAELEKKIEELSVKK